MSVRGDVEINLKDGVSAKSKNINSSLSQIEQKSKSAFNTMATSSQTAATQLKATTVQMNQTRIQSIGLATSIAGMGASFVALETTMTNIPKRLKAIEQAEVSLQRVKDTVAIKTVTLDRLELQLQKARDKGNKTAAEMKILEDKIGVTKQQLSTYTADLAVKQEDLNLKHADYADTLKLMATSIFTTFLTAGASISIMLTQQAIAAETTAGALVKTKLAVIANSKFMKLAVFDIGAFTASMKLATVATGAFGTVVATTPAKLALLRAGLHGVWVALGPVGWAVLGIVGIWEAWNSNLFGFQNIMILVNKKIEEFINNFKPLTDALNFLTGQTEETTSAFERLNDFVFPKTFEEMKKIEQETGEVSGRFADSYREIYAYEEVMAEANTTTAETADTMEGMTDGIMAEMDQKMQELTGTVTGLDNSFQGMYKTVAEHYNFAYSKPFNFAEEEARLLASTLEHTKDQYEKGIISIEDYHLAIDRLIPEITRLDKTFSTARGPNSFIGYMKDMNGEAAELITNLGIIDKEKKSLSDDGIVKEITESTGTGKLKDIETIRQEVKKQLDQDLVNIRNKSGALISLMNQEYNAKFAALKRDMEYRDNYWRGHIESQLIANKLVEDKVTRAIRNFNAQTGNNYADPNFETGGGFTPGGASRNRKAQQLEARREKRRQQEAEAQRYYDFFGKKPDIIVNRLNFRTHLSLHGFPNLEESQQQLNEFDVPLDFSRRDLTFKIRDAIPGRWARNVYNKRRYWVPGQPAVYETINKVPTKFEAVLDALRISQERENIYNQAVNTETDLIELERRYGPIHEILAYNSSNPHAETEALNRYRYETRIILEANLV